MFTQKVSERNVTILVRHLIDWRSQTLPNGQAGQRMGGMQREKQLQNVPDSTFIHSFRSKDSDV